MSEFELLSLYDVQIDNIRKGMNFHTTFQWFK